MKHPLNIAMRVILASFCTLLVYACSCDNSINNRITNEMLQAASKVEEPLDSGIVFVAVRDNGLYHEDPYCINLSNRTGLLSAILEEDAIKLGLAKCMACWYRENEYIDKDGYFYSHFRRVYNLHY